MKNYSRIIYQYFLIFVTHFVVILYLPINQAKAQCTTNIISTPTAQMGAMIGPQFVNLWKQAGAVDKHGQYFKQDDALSIGDDGWPINGKKHGIRFYPNDVIPRMKAIDTLKIKYRGPASAFGSMNPDQWQCKYQNIQSVGSFTMLELVTKPDWLSDGVNGFWFQFEGHIEDIQIIRPGYKIDDNRLLTDEYVKHIKASNWKATRYMGILAASNNFAETWAKKVSPNAPMNINTYQWSAPSCNNPAPQFQKFSEDVVPFQTPDGRIDGMWSRGAPWETIIDISNYLNIDMWINLPVMADDDYVRQLAALIKKRLKPSLNVNVEIGNELWNPGPPFMGFYMLRQKLGDEWREQNKEKLKILGGKYCPGCDLSSSDEPIDRGKCENGDWTANQRWQARRLKEHAESFATLYGWKDEGGEVGTKIRMVLAGQFYGGNGMGWNIGPGIEFLQKAYGDKAPGKYLYAVALAPYIGPHARPDKETEEQFVNMSMEDIERRANANADSYFQDFNELWTTNPRPIYFGNLMEGVFAKARMFGLKFFAYEGGNELSTGGANWGDGKLPRWVDQKNADAYLSSPRAAALSKRFFDRWFSWFGYDALFMKNGDYQSIPMGGYSMSHTLNEDLPMRNEYVRIANSPAVPLSKERGNLLNGESLQYLDARKTAAYNSDWENNAFGFPTKGYGTSVNSDYTFKSSNSMESPFIIRCQKAGKYKFSIERSLVDGRIESDKLWPTYCDIYINEKLVAEGVNLEAETFSRNIKYDVDGYDRVFWWTKDLVLDIPYGVHVLRVHPSAPTAARPGNDGYYGTNNIFANKFDLAQYRFKYDSPTVPKMPKGIIGEGTTVCKSNSKALYEVQELDMGACEYVWSGIPTGAKILPLELVAGSNPARFLSGQGTHKIYIDWGTVLVGTYNLQVLAKNEVGNSDPLKFTVKVQTCGFEINPTPVCKNEQTTFTPESMTGVSKFLWDNGIDGAADRYTTLPTATPFKYTYTKPGIYYPTLTTQDAEGKTIDVYRNTVNVTACNEPIVASPIRYCKGETAQPLTAILNSSSRPATGLKWYMTSSGGSEIPTPTPSTSTAGTKTYYVSQVYSPTAESDRAAIVVNFADAPAKPTVVGENPFVFCQTYSSSLEDLAKKVSWEAGATPRWYATASGEEGTLNPTIPAVGGAMSIFISAEKLTCESERLELKITKVSKGPEFIVETKNSVECGKNGEIHFVLYNSPSQNFKVSYNGLPAKDTLSTDKSRIILSLTSGTYKNFKVSQDGCESVMNAPRTIENKDNSAIGGITRADTNLLPENGNTVLRISYYKGDIKWQVSKDGAPYKEIPGAIKDTVGTGNLSMGVYSYKVLLTNGSCLVPVSSTISVIKVGQPVQPIPGTVRTTTASLCFDGAANLNAQGYTGTIQWQNSAEGSNFVDIAGANLPNYTSTPLTKNVWYRTQITTTAGMGIVYSNKVMVSVNPSLLSDAAASNFSVIHRQSAACGELGAIVLKGLSLMTAFKVSYKFNGSLVDLDLTSAGDSIRISFIKGTYADFKVSIGTCSKTVLGSHTLIEPIAVPLVEIVGNFNYCQDQTISKSDLISRVKAADNGVLKWYITKNGLPAIEPQPEALNTKIAGEKRIWVRQTVNNCDSDTLGLKIVVAPSIKIEAKDIDPTSCVLADGKIEITGLSANNDYQIEYKKAGISAPLATIKSDGLGKITLGNLSEGIYTSITATPLSGSNCLTNSKDTLQLASPLAPTIPPTVVGGDDYCAGITIAALAATPNSAGKIDWFIDPALTTSVATDQNIYTTGQVSGKVTYYAVEKVGDCKSPSAQATINIIAKPAVQIVTGTDGSSTCNATAYTMSLDDSELGVIYIVYRDSNSMNLIQNGDGNAIIFPSQSEEGIYTIRAESEIQNCKEVMNGDLTIGPKKYPQIYVTSGKLEGCEGTVGSNVKINLSNSEEFVLYTLVNPNIPSTKLGTGATFDFVIQAKSENNGLYTIVAQNSQSGCESAMSGEALINIKSGVGTPTLSGDNLYCNNRKNEILIAVENATEKVWSISPQTAGTIDNFGVVTWDSVYTGPATIKVSVTNSACGTGTKTAEFATTVTASPEVSTILGDSLVCKGNIVTYRIFPQVGIAYTWSINTNTFLEENDLIGRLTVTFMEDLAKEGAILSVTPSSLRCGNGDTQTKTIKKDIGCDLFVPNIVTLNTADNNSVWQLEGVDNYPKLSIQIFNRWGAEVHSHTGKYDKPWDGTTSGKPLPTATYYYVIDKKDGTAKITGSVTVVRD